MECPRCGLQNTEAARFCPGCGNALGGASLTERPPLAVATLASNDRQGVLLRHEPRGDSLRSDPPLRGDSLRSDPPLRGDSLRSDPPLRGDSLRSDPPLRGDSLRHDGAPRSDPPLRHELPLEVPRPEPPRPSAVPRPASVPRLALAAPEVFELVHRPDLPRLNGADILAHGHRPAVGGAALAHLAVISQDGSTGQTYWIEQGSVDIGRDEGDIRLSADRFVSPRHARIALRGSTFYLRDLDSLNGVYLRVRESEELKDGDSVLLGSEVLRFCWLSDAEQGLGPAIERGTDVYGSPARPRYACLCERTVEGVYRNVFYISADETVIGREFGDLVFTADSFMSRRHAAIQRDPMAGTFSVRDLGSSNGTYLAIRGEVELREGDHLRVGQHLFRFGFGS
jgi:pSer/pThr/pTyr-binding forkhead associated (FHA) protein